MRVLACLGAVGDERAAVGPATLWQGVDGSAEAPEPRTDPDDGLPVLRLAVVLGLSGTIVLVAARRRRPITRPRLVARADQG